MAENAQLMELTAEIVASFLKSHTMASHDVPGLIQTVRDALGQVDDPEPPAAEPRIKLTAAQIRKSITPERLISFEDGEGYTMLRRHLTARGMTPSDYRQKWGLPADYPMTAPNYSQTRSNLAKSLGLGRNLAARPRGHKGNGAASAG